MNGFSAARDAMSVAELVAFHGRSRPSCPAFIDGETEFDWQTVDDAVTQAADKIAAEGVKPGDRVAFLLRNAPSSYFCLLGAMRAGAIIAPISPMLSPDSGATLLADSGASAFIVDARFRQHAELMLSSLPDGAHPASIRLEDMLTTDNSPSARPALNVADPATLIYSSGTTGLPKGILHNHGARLWMAAQCALAFSMQPTSRVLLTTPPHTNGSWMMVLPALFVGGAVIFTDGFSVESTVDAVSKLAPTHAFLVPTQMTMLMAEPSFRDADLSSFDCIVTAGAPMPAALKQEVMHRIPGVLHELWGLTEGVGTTASPQDLAQKPDSVGRCIPGCEIRIVDENDKDITGRGVGEIVGRSLFLMDCYWNRATATSELEWGSDTGSVMLRTGDLGETDAEGFLYLRGRAKDMIISGGINIYPIDIESVLLTHDAVHDVTVIGVPHAKWGETPVAVILVHGGAATSEAAILDWYNQRADRHQRVAQVIIRDADFPRNTLGKVVKAELLEQLERDGQINV